MKFNNLYISVSLKELKLKTDCRCVGKNVFNKKRLQRSPCPNEFVPERSTIQTKSRLHKASGRRVFGKRIQVFRNVFIEITYMGNVFAFFQLS